MNHAEAIEALQDLAALRAAVVDPEAFGLARLRACHELLMHWAPIVASYVRAADEQELAAARARVAEIEKRLGRADPKAAPAVPERARSDYEETDAGRGIGGSARDEESVDGIGAQDFRNELAELRERGRAKRRQRGMV